MSSSDDAGYDLTELLVLKFVLGDVIIVAALVFAGPLYAVAITALLLASVFLVWYLSQRFDRESADGADAGGATVSANHDPADVDPVTTLQDRYASGELTEAEFERRLDLLLDADERAEAADVETRPLSLERE